MKQSIARQKLSKIPKSKKNKISFELSFKAKNRFSKFKYDSINKETLDGSCVDTLFFNPESINDSKASICKNNSLRKMDNKKVMVFTSSLKYPFDTKKNTPNGSKTKFSKKTFELSEENFIKDEKSNTLLLNDGIELGQNNLDKNDTDRIDYRHYPKIPEIETNKEMKYYWLATYDKLMKKSKIIKILNYYNVGEDKTEKENNLDDKQFNFKEKSLIIPGFEIYFLKNFNKPFIRQKNGGKIFIKLYLLDIEQINKIFSYINRLEYKSYINDLDEIKKKNFYKNIINFNKSMYNYSTIFCLGSFMNINIYLFSHIENDKKEEINDINELPSSNKLAKLIKVLMLNFPDYNKNHFIDYLTNYIRINMTKDNSLNDKKKEISNLLTSAQRKSFQLNTKKHNTNSIIKNIIQKIPTYSNSLNNTPDEFQNLSSINNISDINKMKQTKDISNLAFFNKISTKKEIKKQISEKILNKINSSSFQLSLRKTKKNTRLINKSCQLSKKFVDLTNNTISQNNSKKLDILSKSIKRTKLINPIKKSLTGNNIIKPKIVCEGKEPNNNKIQIKVKNRGIFNNKHNFVIKIEQGKENIFSLINNNYNREKFNTDLNYKNMNNDIIKTDINKNNTRNKMKANFNPFYCTNANNTNNMYNGKRTTKVLLSIKKIISQKLNNITGNSNSVLGKVNLSNSNNSIQGDINNLTKINYKNLVYFSNNNSKNITSEYITPRKKRLYYYYH